MCATIFVKITFKDNPIKNEFTFGPLPSNIHTHFLVIALISGALLTILL